MTYVACVPFLLLTLSEFPESRIMRVFVSTWSTCQRACVPAWFTYQCACVQVWFKCQYACMPASHFYLPTCQTECQFFKHSSYKKNAKENFYTLLSYKNCTLLKLSELFINKIIS